MTSQQHALFGSHDRFLFDPDGNLCKNATFIDQRNVMLKVNTNYLDIDHLSARHEVINKTDKSDDALFPLVRVEDGQTEAFDYNINVYKYPKAASHTKFSHISRWHRNSFYFWGGISSLVVDLKGNWRGMSKETVDAYMAWSLKTYFDHIDGYGRYFVDWLNKCRTSASMQQSKSTVQVLADALRTQEELKALHVGTPLIGHQPTVDKHPTEPIPAIQEPIIEVPIVEPEPLPVPLEGSVNSIDKLPSSVVELV